jgi:integrase/recombinase XerD
MNTDDIFDLRPLWEISLKSGHKSPHTIRAYLTGLDAYVTWAAENDRAPDLSRRSVEAFTAWLLGRSSAGTAGLRQVAVRQFSAWCASQDPPEIPRDELAGMRAPKLDSKIVDGLTGDELRALLAACAGRHFTDVRDTALVRLMVGCGARADEVVSMKTWDISIETRTAVVVRGKGGRGRRVGYGDKVAESLGRYQRARRKHPLAGRPEFWLAQRRRVLTYDGLYQQLTRRAEVAGLEGFFPHKLRHTWAVSWARSGGSAPGLQAAGGWQSLQMVQRYFGSAAQDLAAAEARRLGLGGD